MEDVTRVARKPFKSAFCIALCLLGVGSTCATPKTRSDIETEAASAMAARAARMG